MLGYGNPHNALSRHVDSEDKGGRESRRQPKPLCRSHQRPWCCPAGSSVQRCSVRDNSLVKVHAHAKPPPRHFKGPTVNSGPSLVSLPSKTLRTALRAFYGLLWALGQKEKAALTKTGTQYPCPGKRRPLARLCVWHQVQTENLQCLLLWLPAVPLG